MKRKVRCGERSCSDQKRRRVAALVQQGDEPDKVRAGNGTRGPCRLSPVSGGWLETDTGTPQGEFSRLLANIYLHYSLDESRWAGFPDPGILS